MAGYLHSPLLSREGDGYTFVCGDVNRCIDERVVVYFADPAAAHGAVGAAEPERWHQLCSFPTGLGRDTGRGENFGNSPIGERAH